MRAFRPILALLSVAFWFCSGAMAQDAETFALQPGQVWTFDAPEGQADARLIVSQIEDHAEHGPVVHISIVNVSAVHPQTGAPTLVSIMHMAFARAAVKSSVNTLDGDSDPPEYFEAALDYWRSVKPGVWTIPVGEALTAMLEAEKTGNLRSLEVR